MLSSNPGSQLIVVSILRHLSKTSCSHRHDYVTLIVTSYYITMTTAFEQRNGGYIWTVRLDDKNQWK